jgi:hypothetical protein
MGQFTLPAAMNKIADSNSRSPANLTIAVQPTFSMRFTSL